MSKKKFIRRQSFISKLQSFPFDTYLYINEIISSIDWNNTQSIHIANILGISLTLIDLFITSILNYYQSINSKSNNLLFNSNYYDYQYLKRNLSTAPQYTGYHISSFIWLLSLISNTIIFINVLNLIILLKSSRKYGLLYLTDTNKSTSIYKHSSWLGFIDTLFNKFTKEPQQEEVTANSLDDETTIIEDDIYYMNTWDPNKFTLHLFIGFNPINICITHISSISISLTMIILATILFWIIISKFNQLIIDKQIIYQEMFKEYNKKFVNPKLNILKKDVVIDATNGPYGIVLTDKQPYLLSKTRKFVTHDAKGNEIIEIGEYIPKFTYVDHSTLPTMEDLNYQEPPWYNSSTPYQPRISSSPRIKSPSITASTPNRLLSPQRLNMNNRTMLGYDNERSSRQTFTSPSPVRLGIRSGSRSGSVSPIRSVRYDMDRGRPNYDRDLYERDRYEQRQSYDRQYEQRQSYDRQYERRQSYDKSFDRSYY